MSEQIPITRSASASTTATQRVPDVVRQALTAPGDLIKSSAPKFTVTLPSQGYFYSDKSPLSSGTIQLFEVTAKHEDILSNTTLLKRGTVLDEFLRALIVSPDITLDDILIGDKNAIFLAARRSAYGDEYKLKTKCPSCEKEVTITADLSLIGIKPIDFDGLVRNQNQFTFVLPVSEKQITWKLLTHKDESSIEGELKNLSKLSSGSSSSDVTTRLKYTIISVDGKTERGFIKSFVDNEFSARDSLAFRTHVKSHTPDMDMTYDFACLHCDHTDHLPLPLGANFFWPGVSE